MKRFSDKEIETQIFHHQELSNRYNNLLGKEIFRFNFFIDTVDSKYMINVPVRVLACQESIEWFFLAMSSYHNNEKLKWQMIRDGIDPSETVGSFKIKNL